MYVLSLSQCFSLFAIFSAVIRCASLTVETRASGGLTLQFSASTTTVGTRAVYSCSNNTYQITGGAMRVCGANGEWTGEEPHCECM